MSLGYEGEGIRMWNWVIGFGCSAIVAYSAYKRRSLSLSGMLAAITMGTIFFAMGSLLWFGILLAFFVSSSVMSHVKKSAKETYEAAYEKTGRRDAGQVFANGGMGMLLCIAFAINPSPVIVAAFVGVMATVTADTCNGDRQLKPLTASFCAHMETNSDRNFRRRIGTRYTRCDVRRPIHRPMRCWVRLVVSNPSRRSRLSVFADGMDRRNGRCVHRFDHGSDLPGHVPLPEMRENG